MEERGINMINKCIVCGKAISIDYTVLLTPHGISCLQHEGSKELEETLEKIKNREESEIMLNDKEKLELINKMEFIESDADCDGIIYVLVEDNQINRDILHKIGLTDEDIERDCYGEDETLDISMVAFRYSNYYDSKGKIFYNKPELNIKSMAVVKMEDLTDYLMTCKEDCWTKSGWDKLFEKLETSLTYASE